MRKALVAALLICGVATGDEVPQGNPTINAGTFKGQASFVPWSGTWWPMKDGQLAKGWNGHQTYTYNASTKTFKFNANVATNNLSPLAKYDKYVGNSPENGAAMLELMGDGDFMHHVFGDLKKQYDEDDVDYSWWGHCNGWAAAAALEDEPVTSVEKNGIRFEVADLKGLLTESYFGVVSSFSGSRYNKPSASATESFTKAKDLLAKISNNPPAASVYRAWYEKAFSTTLDQDYTPAAYKGVLEYYIKYYNEKYVQAYEDIRPDVFHKILTQVIGQQKQVVVFDITASEAVWNYPAYAYETTLVDQGTKKIDGYTRRVFAVTTKVSYGDDGVSESILGTNTFTKTYTYELYTTPYYRKLKGGKWTGASVDNHPDFAWFPKYNPTGADDEENVKLLYGKILEILPKSHLSTEAKKFQLFANGTGSESCRTSTSPVTWWKPVVTGKNVSFTWQSTLTNVAEVKLFKQKVSQPGSGVVKATRDALSSIPASATLTTGKHMIVAFAYDASGTLLAVDEITVQVQ